MLCLFHIFKVILHNFVSVVHCRTGKAVKMSSPKIEFYDVSPKMRAILEFKQRRRLELRQEYLRERMHPVKQRMFTDTAMDRFANMRHLHDYRLVTDGKRLGFFAFLIFGSVAFFGRWLQLDKEKEERRLRTGLVPYADRKNKFV